MEIRRLTREAAADVKLKNEPFSKPGRFIPELKDGRWSWREELYETAGEQTFPEEDYDFEDLSRTGVLLGAYENNVCIGLAVFQDAEFRCLYLDDLKVCAGFRGKGVGRALVEAGMEAAKDRGYAGIYAIAQDDNLNACRFYLKTGFQVGGFDNRTYEGTSQEGKGDIFFYKM